MIIDYNAMEWQENPGFKGGEGIFLNKMYDDGTNKMMTGRLKPGCSIGYHRHEANCEIIFVIEGTGEVVYDGEKFEVGAGQCHYCPNGHEHSLSNHGKTDLVFYAAVPGQ
ncbi:MAG: cupin domain-containing protein [Saccharofermentans sp.]|jgi:mannose-6-phosphate isomerase-like protein (cupin superfamily)|nr:cupin domain-containing protein [Mageeibacillus sp.]MCI1264536.1 cupin domain-containing protein [Saccharofermentans sp.]MCI1274685.1 cupin domain-containing protein [Saccharofermentans sp.]MCI2044567.1 cupin domain-containing protein [Mageeibacillus sp.]